MRVPIRLQLMGPLLVVAAASLGVVALVYARIATTETRARMERQARGVAEVLSRSSFPLTDAVLSQMAGLAGAEFLLADRAGDRVASSGPRADAVLGSVRQTPIVTAPADVDLRRSVRSPAEVFFHSALRVSRPTADGDWRTLHLLVPKADYDAAWRDAFVPPLVVGVAAAGAIAAVTLVATGRISRLMAQIGAEVNRLADGDFRPVHVPQLDDESRDLALAVNRAASRLTDYEAKVRQTERLRTLATLGAGMAHEVRNAATGCRMAIDLHAGECPASPAGVAGGVAGGVASGLESLDIARKQLRLIEGRLKQFLSVGKTTSPEPPRIVDLNQVVREALELTGATTEHAGVAVPTDLPTTPCPVLGVAEELTHSVVNLLLNASEAASRRRALEGTPSRVCVRLVRLADTVELTVTDSGSGPDRAVADRIFDPFVSEKPEGVGLGLAVVQSAVEASGGNVAWDRIGDETRFVVRLPAATDPAAIEESLRG
ncbi:Sporulation kinase E [Botrimarina colliarenosi]|uniref:histidine kinase n=1 Tax=Botrimarina colliarenosi TaxID=2528001 RepID=A0A5C6AEI9_9BACT|nr:ATP-binding protein [Botrimarina colliarenosi]TWT97728.1 Sporulation kinase E [Botrimarina colliarenosi]